jgi:hypothetical protein
MVAFHGQVVMLKLSESSCCGCFCRSLESRGCSVAKLYDLALMSHTVRVILSNSKEWQDTLVREDVVFVQVEGVKSEELERNLRFQQAHVINRTANKLAW